MVYIRKYQDHDLESLNVLLQEAYKEFNFTRKGRKDPKNLEVVAIVENQVVGYLVCNQLYDVIEDIHYGYVNDVCVLKKYQNKGIATKMFHYLFDQCKKDGLSYLELTSNKSRVAAHHLYQKLDFYIRKTDVFRKDIL